ACWAAATAATTAIPKPRTVSALGVRPSRPKASATGIANPRTRARTSGLMTEVFTTPLAPGWRDRTSVRGPRPDGRRTPRTPRAGGGRARSCCGRARGTDSGDRSPGKYARRSDQPRFISMVVDPRRASFDLSRPDRMYPPVMSRFTAWSLLAVFGIGVFLAGLELMITATALPSILLDLAITDQIGKPAFSELRHASWIITGSLLAY